MTPDELKEYNDAQIEWIDVAKWYLGEKLGRDPGQEFVRQWIKEHAKEFRDNWPSYSAEYRANHKK